MGVINRLIKKQPSFIENVYYNLVPFRYRYGKIFSDTSSFLHKVDEWSYDKSIEYQFKELKKVLHHCHNNVPYYQKTFAKYGFNPNIQSFDDIKKLPLLTKDLINDNFDDLISKINTAIEKHDKGVIDQRDAIDMAFTKDNFRQGTPDVSGYDDIKKLKTNLTDKMFKNIPLSVKASSDLPAP